MVEKLGVSMQSGTPKFIVSSVEHSSILFSLELLINNVLGVAKPTQKSLCVSTEGSFPPERWEKSFSEITSYTADTFIWEMWS